MSVEKTEPVEKTPTRLPVAECVSFLLVKEGSCLLERRSATKASDPNIIAIPGGISKREKTKRKRCSVKCKKS